MLSVLVQQRYGHLMLPTPSPHDCMAMQNWNQKSDTLESLDSLTAITCTTFAILIVDIGSTDGSTEATA